MFGGGMVDKKQDTFDGGGGGLDWLGLYLSLSYKPWIIITEDKDQLVDSGVRVRDHKEVVREGEGWPRSHTQHVLL